ncbi:hypothetical protein GEMRC1_009149 [Eukaryota sp. GEM-RC1]
MSNQSTQQQSHRPKKDLSTSNGGFVPYNTILNMPRMKAIAKRKHKHVTSEEVFKYLKKIPHVICDRTRGIKPVNTDFGPVEDIKRTFISVFPLTSGAEVIEIFEHLREQHYMVTSFSGIFLNGFHMANIKLATETEALRIVNKSTLRIGAKQYLVIPKFTETGDHNSVDSETECSVCYGEMTHGECSTPITSNCKHSRKVFNSCIARWIDEKVMVDHAMRPIKCLHANCDEHLHSNDVQKFASTFEIYQSFETGSTIQCLQADPDFRWCPHEGCGNGFFINRVSRYKVTCNHCHHDVCADDKVPWHSGQTCSEYREQIENDNIIRNALPTCPSCNAIDNKQMGSLDHNCRACCYYYWWCCRGPCQIGQLRNGHTGDCCMYDSEGKFVGFYSHNH